MVDKRLLGMMGEDRKYLIGNVIFMWLSLMSNIGIMLSVAYVFKQLYTGVLTEKQIWLTGIFLLAALIIRYGATRYSAKMSYLSSRNVKKTFRKKIYEKLLKLGVSYREAVNSSELVQITVEGVDQLETYFGGYLPQFFYSMIAPVTLFAVLSFISFKAALILLICVPLIPLTIAAVQTFAKKLLSKYWNGYTELGDTFLENLNGLTVLKVYDADEKKNIEMNEKAEKFRKATMKVLSMQLNSITVMDLVAYGGTALGIIISVREMYAGNLDLFGGAAFILLASEFFLPMRQLGSFFHIATNGMAASEKIFGFLETEEPVCGDKPFPSENTVSLKGAGYGYDKERKVLENADMTFREREVTAIVGESGSGKSTVAGLITGRNRGYSGHVEIGVTEISLILENEIQRNITYVGSDSYLFRGTVKENLLMGNPDATEEMLEEAVRSVNLKGFLDSEKGLYTPVSEQATNLSGGQRQRIAIARALLHDSRIYIFDEATSNIDTESEALIMKRIYELAEKKTVILIFHRLANVEKADNIYVISGGHVSEEGSHEELLKKKGSYYGIWNAQKTLEDFGKAVDEK